MAAVACGVMWQTILFAIRQLDAHTIKVVANIKSPGMSIKLLFLIRFSIHILTLLSNFLLTTGNLNFTLKGLPTARPLNFVNIT